MSQASVNQSSMDRPRRWDMPFSQEAGHDSVLTDADIDSLLANDAFSRIDPAGFKRSVPLREILRNDVRIVDFEQGDVIVRQGDWGSSAFFVLSGAVRVELDRGDDASSDLIQGRQKKPRKTFFRSLAQLWQNNHHAEFRNPDAKQSVSGNLRSVGGVTRVYISDVSAVIEQHKTARMDAGHWFGELAALGRTPRVATVFADETSTLLEIRWQGLRDILRFDRDQGLKKYIEDVFRERAMASLLRTERLFADISDQEMADLMPHCRLETFGEYDTAKPFRELSGENAGSVKNEPLIAEQGDYPNAVFLIRSGVARLSQKHHAGRHTVGYLNPGRVFGLREVLQGFRSGRSTGYEARLSAIGYLNAVVIPASIVEDLLRSGAISDPEDSCRPAVHATHDAVDENLLNFLVDGKYVQGTETMVIDMDRCTRCDDCVRACATTHDNNPRFIRHGPVSVRHMVANACMHCLDPVCMIECPTGAIHRETLGGLVLINDQTCIGCAQCASNCPFDAIRMVETRNASGAILVDSKNAPILEATKCDLCHDQPGGPACQRACPHDALERIDLQSLSELEGVIAR
ncbi:MAG: cyclic nucleotide-binding domain-containing protein [Fuerstiella sp.]|nr:cyclic nucleotide-binding domain-containing protein [Fuerstiella sp.]